MVTELVAEVSSVNRFGLKAAAGSASNLRKWTLSIGSAHLPFVVNADDLAIT